MLTGDIVGKNPASSGRFKWTMPSLFPSIQIFWILWLSRGSEVVLSARKAHLEHSRQCLESIHVPILRQKTQLA